jgi:succinate dehydrogenase / fumarate reductase flavoprotein subunit
VRALGTTPRADDEQIRSAIRSATDILNRESGENPYLLHEALQDCMEDNVGIIRQEDELKTGIEQLGRLKERATSMKADGASQFNPGWHEALSMRSLLVTAEAVARAALMRQESRGAHTREDYPGERNEWLEYNVVIRKGRDGDMQVEKVKRAEPPAHLKDIAHATLEDLEAGKVGADAPED